MNRFKLVPGILVVVFCWSVTWAADQPNAAQQKQDQPQQTADSDAQADAIVALWPVDPPPLKPELHEEVVNVRPPSVNHPGRMVSYVIHPTLTAYLPEHPDADRPALVICPGGGYGAIAIDWAGRRVAERMSEAGIACFVLKYRLPIGLTPGPDQLPPPIQDVQQALRLLRSQAEKWNIDPDHLGIIGFSAGGHLAGMAATLFEEYDASVDDALKDFSCRPDFAALMYPVASLHPDIAHMGSRNKLIGANADVTVEDRFSIAQRITPRTPPLFVSHAADDPLVKIIHSEQIVAAAEKQGVPCTFVRFVTGGHGYTVGPPAGDTDVWVDQFLAWLKDGNFLAGEALP